MTVRMSKALAEQIADNAVKAAGFHEREKEMCAEYAAISRELLPECWVSMHQQKTNKKITWEQIKSKIDATIENQSEIDWARSVTYQGDESKTANISGVALTLSLSGYFTHRGQDLLSQENTVSGKDYVYRFPYYSPNTPIIVNEEKRERIISLFTEHVKLIADAQTLKADVANNCVKYRTVKQLLQAWPEVLPLIPETEAKASVQLPAIPVADLNARIGLPK